MVGGHKVRARQYPWGTVEGERKEREGGEGGREGGTGEGRKGKGRREGGEGGIYKPRSQFSLGFVLLAVRENQRTKLVDMFSPLLQLRMRLTVTLSS